MALEAIKLFLAFIVTAIFMWTVMPKKLIPKDGKGIFLDAVFVILLLSVFFGTLRFAEYIFEGRSGFVCFEEIMALEAIKLFLAFIVTAMFRWIVMPKRLIPKPKGDKNDFITGVFAILFTLVFLGALRFADYVFDVLII